MNQKYKKIMMPDGFSSVNPPPTKDELHNFYAKTYYQDPKSHTYQKAYTDIELSYKKLKCEALIWLLNKYIYNNEKSFIDIGAGEGFLLNAAYENSYEITGLDFSNFGISKFFPHLLPKFLAGDLFQSLSELIDKNKRFNFCVSTNVLEHVLEPNLFLQSLKKVLLPGGVVAITVPNDYSDIQNLALQEKFIDKDFWFLPPEHLHYFNSENLVKFLQRNGFNLIDAFSDFPIDIFLLHSGSNYAINPENGNQANQARMLHDIMIINKYGFNKYLEYYRAMFNIGLGRNITVILRLN